MMQTRIETISGEFATAGAPVTINDLPFPRANLSVWVGGTSVVPIDQGNQVLVDAFIDKNTGQLYDRGGDNAGVIVTDSSPSGLPVLGPRISGSPGTPGYLVPSGFSAAVAGRTVALIGRRPTGTSSGYIVREVNDGGTINLGGVDEYGTDSLRVIARRDEADSGTAVVIPVPSEWYSLYLVLDYTSQQIRYQVSGEAEIAVPAFTDGSGAAPTIPGASRRMFRPPTIVGQYYDIILIDGMQDPVARAMTQNYLRSMTNILNGV